MKIEIDREMQRNIYIDVDDVQTAYDNLLFVFGTKPFVANAKCQQIKWLSEYLSLSNEDRGTFGTDMVFIAKKEVFSPLPNPISRIIFSQSLANSNSSFEPAR